MGSELDDDKIMNPVLLECRKLTKRFGDKLVIDHLDLDLVDGEILSILGPSGCGKSTLLRLIAGLEQPDGGTIKLGADVFFTDGKSVPTNKRGLGMVFQEYALFPHLTVEQNVLFGISKLPSNIRENRIRKVMGMTKLDGLESRFPSELSGGEQQRAALARTLATQPSLMLMDEPFSNLDASLRSSLRNEVENILRLSEAATIYVTHDRDEAFSISDRVAIMLEGKIHQIDPPDQIYFWPTTKNVASMGGICSFIPGVISNNSVLTSLGELPLRVITNLRNGTHVEVSIRPNDFIMTPDPEGTGVVTEKEFRGDDTLFWVETATGETICCKHKIRTTLFVGLRVSLSTDQYVKFNVFPI